MDGFISVAAFGAFVVLWAAFTYALIWSQVSLDQAWEGIRGLPLILQAIVALLLLPVVAGLWVWDTTWPLVVRLALVGGLGVVNLYMFLPRTLLGGRI